MGRRIGILATLSLLQVNQQLFDYLSLIDAALTSFAAKSS
jgi:hypothetical protein